MTSASVGFQCPECVQAGAASMPSVRSPLGTTVAERPIVTITLIGLNVVAFGYEYLAGLNAVIGEWGMRGLNVALQDQYYRLFTSMFLHGSVLHIGFNMLVLWMLGPSLERILGHGRYVVLYLIAGFGGQVASFWFTSPGTASVGASGAIFGLMGAYVVVGKALRTDISQVLGLIGINIVIGFVAGGIDWRAHLGGLLTGAAVAAVFAFLPRKVVLQVVAVAGILGLLAWLVVVRDDALTQQVLTGLLTG
jgi:membrane associated rhomboid family serine protease